MLTKSWRPRLQPWLPVIISSLIALLVWLPLAQVSHLVGVYLLASRRPLVEDGELLLEQQIITVLFLGIDTEDLGQPQSSVRSDSIIVGTVNLQTNVVRLLSIPRDTYVHVPGYGMDKINHAFAFGGGTRRNTGLWLTQDTVIEFLGIEGIDYYAIVDMVSVRRLVDAIGGVEIDVDISDPRLPPKGLHLLNGKQTLVYARWRSDHMGDINRVKRQQKLLLAIFEQVGQQARPSLLSNINLLRFALSEVRTNVTIAEAVHYAVYLRNIETSDIEFYHVPGSFMNLRGISYWNPDLDALREIIQHVFYSSPDSPDS